MIKIKLFLTILVCLIIGGSALAVQSGKVEYVVPFDYSQIDEVAVSSEAELLFNKYMNTGDYNEKVNLLALLLHKYSILSLVNIENPLYFTRLGIIYDKLNNNRYALMNFYRATNLASDNPYALSSFGNYYFSRYNFKKALHFYIKAYECGYNFDYDTLYNLGVIYEKYGDFSNAIKFYKDALSIKNTDELNNKIILLEQLLSKNSLYNLDRGLKN